MDIYPTLPGLDFNVRKTATFRTLVQEAFSGRQVRIASYVNPIWQFHLEYEFLRDGQFKGAGAPFDEWSTLMGFVAARSGDAQPFLFLDPTDNGGLVQPLQRILDNAGKYWSPIQRKRGASLVTPFWEDLTDLVPNAQPGGTTLNVYDNGVLKTAGTDYTFSSTTEGLIITLPSGANQSFLGLYIQWINNPVGPVTADFNFYFRCHFAGYQSSARSASRLDTLETTNFMNGLWEARTVEFETSRP